MKSFELNRFAKTSKEELENMTDSEIHSLNLLEKIERFVIVEGYGDFSTCRKIEIADIERTGFDSFKASIIFTKKRCRYWSYSQKFEFDEIHETVKELEYEER